MNIEVNIGDRLPPLALAPVSRHTLALYCGASGDHNPLHVDSDFAKAAGLPDVIAHGMLSMAWLGRFLTQWQPQAQLRDFKVRFSAMTKIAEHITCTGQVIELLEVNGERCVKLTIQSANEQGEIKLQGEAIVVLAK